MQEAANKILSEFNTKKNTNYEIVEIASAKSQVVAGIQYEIELVVALPECNLKASHFLIRCFEKNLIFLDRRLRQLHERQEGCEIRSLVNF